MTHAINNPRDPRQELSVLCPAALTAGPDTAKVSEKYRYVSTIEVIEAAMGLHYYPVTANPGSRKDSIYGRHLVQLVHEDYLGVWADRKRALLSGEVEVIPNMILSNSHNATSAIRLTAGLYRLVCSNGLMANGKLATRQVIRHVGQEFNIEGVILNSLRNVGLVESRVSAMKSRMLTPSEMMDFAIRAAALRMGEEVAVNLDGTPVNSVPWQRVLRSRRIQDRIDFNGGSSLWTTFNVAQENLVNGLVRTTGRYIVDENGQKQWKSSKKLRAVEGIDPLVKLNEEMWGLAEDFMVSENGLVETKGELVSVGA